MYVRQLDGFCLHFCSLILTLSNIPFLKLWNQERVGGGSDENLGCKLLKLLMLNTITSGMPKPSHLLYMIIFLTPTAMIFVVV
jgi:hypothetical protein